MLPYADPMSNVGSCSNLNDRARDKAFLGGGIVQATRDVLIRAGRELGVRPQRDAFELPSAVPLLDLHARRRRRWAPARRRTAPTRVRTRSARRAKRP